MGYAVVQIVTPYRPEGDPTRPETTEFTHWIFDTQQEASRNKADLLLGHRLDRQILVRQVEEAGWVLDNQYGRKKK